MGSPVETEVKLRVGDVEALAAAHPELGWTTVAERHFEDNFVFELPEAALERRGSILRLRIARGSATLTYKGLLPESLESAVKVREELETGVERPEALVAIFERLGLVRSFRYQKYRTVYRLDAPEGSLLAMRDETAFGEFLELEGEERVIHEVARLLGLSPDDYITGSYIGMQAALCRARGVPLEDLVFEAGEQQTTGGRD
jgi:predicted adenylyl cyclase CyaB